MTQIRMDGLPDGAAALSVDQNAQNASATPTIVARVDPIADHKFYVSNVNPNATNKKPTMSLSSNNHNMMHQTRGFYPITFTEGYALTAPHANRIISTSFKDSQYTPETLIGGVAEIYRMVNGVFTMVRQSNIIGGDFTGWSSHSTTTGLSYEFRVPGWSGIDNPVWYGVGTIDNNDQMGAVNYQELTTTSRNGPSATTDPLVNNPKIKWAHGGSLAAPANVVLTPVEANGDSFTLSWDAVAGAKQYAFVVSYNGDPALHPAWDAKYLELENDGGVALLAGDYAYVKKRLDAPRHEMVSSRVKTDNATLKNLNVAGVQFPIKDRPLITYKAYGGANLAKPDSALGDMYVSTNLLPETAYGDVYSQTYIGGTSQAFYFIPVQGETYTISFWIYVDRNHDVDFISSIMGTSTETLSLLTGWTFITRDIIPTSTDTGSIPKTWNLRASTVGEASLEISMASIKTYQKNTGHGIFTAEENNLPAGMFIRDHGQIKSGKTVSDIEALTNPVGEQPRGISLDALFGKCLQTGGYPWIQHEFFYTEAEFQDIIAYINAPVASGHPMALKRQAQGRTAPWADAFPKIFYELGNETWNGLSSFWNPPGMTDSVTATAYGTDEMFGYIFRQKALAMQASPYWTSKIEWVIGGHINSSYGENAARTFNLPVHVGYAFYNGGWDVGGTIPKENDDTYKTMLQNQGYFGTVNLVKLTDNLKALALEGGNIFDYGVNLFPICYEAGPGFLLNGLNGAVVTDAEVIVQEHVKKSNAGGTATLDAFMNQAVHGLSSMNFFGGGTRDNWAVQASVALGGGVFPSWQLPAKVHEQMGEFDIFLMTRVADTLVTAKDIDGIDGQYNKMSAYYLKSITHVNRVMLVVCNLDILPATGVTIYTNLVSAASCTVWAHTANYQNSNRYPVGQRAVDTGGFVTDPLSVAYSLPAQVKAVPSDMSMISIDDALGADPTGMPAGSAMLIQFDGVIL